MTTDQFDGADLLRVLLALGLVATTAGAGATLATASTSGDGDVYTIDANHALADADAVATYEQDGRVSARLQQLDMRLTFAQDGGDAGVEQWWVSDVDKHFIRVQYNETISRTLRFYVPSGVFHPHRAEDVEPVENEDVTADFEPVRNGTYTAVTIAVDGPTDVTIPVNAVASSVFRARDEGHTLLENKTGYELPSLLGGSATQWQYIDSSYLSGDNETVPIERTGEELTIQYETGSGTDTVWLDVPTCESPGDAPVCRLTQRRTDDRVLVVNLLGGNETPPQVRYRHGSSMAGGIEADLNELRQIPNRVEEWTSNLFDGLF